MSKRPSLSPAVAEAFVLLNFVALVSGLVLVPLLEPTVLSLAALAFGLTLNSVIAFGYALMSMRFAPPVGKRLVRLGLSAND